MLQRLIVLVLLLSLLPMRSVSAQSDLERAAITFQFAENVLPADEVLIREGIRLAQDYFIATFGTDVHHEVVVDVTNDSSNMIIQAEDYRISLNTTGYAGFPPLMRLQTVVHEYFHIWQQSASGNRMNGLSKWLMEGSADYIGMQAIVSTKLLSPEEGRERTVLMANGFFRNEAPTELPTLQALTTYEGFTNPTFECCAYAISTLGVETLVEDQGVESIGEFFMALSSSRGTWKSAFENSFGISSEDFEADFEARRTDLLAPVGIDVLQLFQLPNFNETPAALELGSAPDTISPGDQSLIYGWANLDGAACTMIVTEEKGRELATYAAYADAYGLVFWFWSAPEELKQGAVQMEMNCGAESITTSVTVE